MKKNYYILILLLVLISLNSMAQNWPKKYYSNNLGFIAWDVISHYDNGFLITGYTINGTQYMYQGLLIKTDINGNMLWNKRIGNNNYYCSINALTYANDNAIIGCGSISKYDDMNYEDPFIIKYNQCFEKEWCTVFRLPGENRCLSVVSTNDGGYTVLIQYYTEFFDSVRISLAHMDARGIPLWVEHQAQYNIPNWHNEEADEVTYTSEGKYLIAGGCSYSGDRPFYIMTDSLGKEEWNIKWDNTLGYIFHTVESPDGFFYSGGQSVGHNWWNGYIPALFKLDKFGNQISYTYLMSPDTIATGGSSSLCFLNDTTIVITSAWCPREVPAYEGFSDVLVIDTSGQVQIVRNLINTPYGFSAGMTKTQDNKILVCGSEFENNKVKIFLWKMNSNLEDDTLYTGNYVYDSLCSHPIASDTTDIDCYLFTDIDKLPTRYEYEHSLQLYPNPVQKCFTLRSPQMLYPEDVITLTNMQGVVVKSISIGTQGESCIMVTEYLPSGVYMVNQMRSNKSIASGKIVVQ